MKASPLLLAHTLEVVAYGPGADDGFGNATQGETGRATVRGRIWQDTTLEATVGRDTATAVWRGVLPPGTAVDAGDRIEWSGQVFEVQGAPAPVYDASELDHLEVTLRWSGPVA